jgi:hypothetical protein
MTTNMNTTECEQVMCAALARLDGESPPLSEKETLDHLAQCQRCREELAALTSALQPLDVQTRRPFEHDLWPDMAAQVSPGRPQAAPKVMILFGLFGLFLLTAKILELSPQMMPGLIIKPISIVGTLIFFCLLKQNPFRICADLALPYMKPTATETLMEASHVSSHP